MLHTQDKNTNNPLSSPLVEKNSPDEFFSETTSNQTKANKSFFSRITGKQMNARMIIQIAGIVILLLGAGAGFLLTQTDQDIRQSAFMNMIDGGGGSSTSTPTPSTSWFRPPALTPTPTPAPTPPPATSIPATTCWVISGGTCQRSTGAPCGGSRYHSEADCRAVLNPTPRPTPTPPPATPPPAITCWIRSSGTGQRSTGAPCGGNRYDSEAACNGSACSAQAIRAGFENRAGKCICGRSPHCTLYRIVEN